MELISVILSTYNEPIDMVKKSVESILNQTYRYIELILINDNPSNEELDNFLKQYSNDKRIIYILHDENKGLIYSLNEGIKIANGLYIARMDADDVSFPDRFEKQLDFLKANNYDMVGSSAIKIDENDNEIGKIMVPSDHKNITKYQRYGSCVLHPTWLLKKEVYNKLNGYRNIYSCEDYDFILRAIASGFKIGNLSEPKLYYRIRENGISVSTNIQQKLTMYYLINNKKNDQIVTIEAVDYYLKSDQYKNDYIMLKSYEYNKKCISNKKICFSSLCMICKILVNKFFYKDLFCHIKRYK